MPWRIQGAENLLVAVYQHIIVHSRDKIGREIRIVPRCLLQQPLLLFESLVELRARKSNEDADHGRNHAAFLDEPDLGVENRKRVAVETDYESSLHLKAGFLNLPDTGKEVAVLVLEFIAFNKALLMGGLDADEDNIKSCPDHHLHEVFMVG